MYGNMGYKIEEIDKNFIVNTNVNKDDIVFLNAKDEPFKVYGAYEPFVRLPKEIAENTNRGVSDLYKNTAGIRVRFSTNSPYVAIAAKVPFITKSTHFSRTGLAGFDIYEYNCGEYKYLRTFEPSLDEEHRINGVCELGDEGMHSLVINFPLYNNVDEFFIGIKTGSDLTSGDNYKIEKPIVYYGSSITQGGCASRPGVAYESIISRRFDADFINLGFSGNALGEQIIAEYISKLDMSVFVLDYDYNAPNYKYLKSTHYNFYKTVRDKNPWLPIIMISMPFFKWIKDQKERRDVIFKTYNKAVTDGDKNVYFIDGSTIPGIFGGDNGTVDGCHPNDLGFMCMAEKIGEVINKALSGSNQNSQVI